MPAQDLIRSLAFDVEFSLPQLLDGVVLDPIVRGTNPDATGFGGGTFTVSTDAPDANDLIGILDNGGPISVSGQTILYNNVAFASIAAATGAGSGQDGNALQINFNPSGVGGAQVTALLSAITLQNSDPGNVVGTRAFTYALIDADGDDDTGVINVEAYTSAAPDIEGLQASQDASINEVDAGIRLDSLVYTGNPDATGFQGGSLVISGDGDISGDVLSIVEEGLLTLDGLTVEYDNVAIGTLSGGNGTPLTIAFDQAPVAAPPVNALLSAILFQNGSATAGTRTFTYTLTDADLDEAMASTNVDIFAGQAPTIQGLQATQDASVNEVDAGVRLDSLVYSGNPDATGFEGGSLVISGDGDISGDQLSIVDHGLLTVNGSTLEYDSAAIGTISGGNGTPLTITFNQGPVGAPPVNALLSAIQFQNGSASAGTRTFTYTLTDADLDEATASTNVEVIVTQTPDILGLQASQNAGVNEVDAGLRLDTLVYTGNPDATGFGGGSLVISGDGDISGDVLSVVNHGLLTVSGSTVSYNGSAIGTISGGTGTPLTIAFNPGALGAPPVNALLSAIQFQNESASAGTRTFTYTLTDADLDEASASTNVVVQATQASNIAGLQTSQDASINEVDAGIRLDTTVSTGNPDATGFQGGSLVVAGDGDISGDVLSVVNNGLLTVNGSTIEYDSAAIGTISGGNGTPLTIVFDQGPVGAPPVNALLSAIQFQSGSASAGTRTFTYTLTDADLDESSATTAVDVFAGQLPNIQGLQASQDASINEVDSGIRLDTLVYTGNPDATGFEGGSLVISGDGDISGDVLSIVDNGLLTVDGSTLEYNNAAIGTISGGNGTPLTVTFNQGAVGAPPVNALLSAIQFQSGTASAGTRTFTYTLTDADLDEASASTNVVVYAGVAPNIQNLDAAREVLAGTVQSGFILDNNVGFSNPNATGFTNGSLVVGSSSPDAGDTLTIAETGLVTLDGNIVEYDGNPIGTFSGGTGGTPLTIAFDQGATVNGARLNAVAQAITLTNGSPPQTTRDFTFTVTDHDLDQAIGTLTLTTGVANQDPGTSTPPPSDLTSAVNGTIDLDISSLTLTDPDSAGNPVVMTLETANGGTLAAVDGGGVTVGGSGTGVLTLTGTIAAIDAYLNTASAIQYTAPTGVSGDDADMVTLTINDQGNSGIGGGGDVALGTVNIDIGNKSATIVQTSEGDFNWTFGGPDFDGLFDLTLVYSTLSGFSATEFTLVNDSDGLLTAVVTGTGFTYGGPGGDPDGGSIASIEFFYDGVSQGTMSSTDIGGLAIPVADFWAAKEAAMVDDRSLIDAITDQFAYTYDGTATSDHVGFRGGAFDDVITGGDGNDNFDGDEGNDILVGGAGRDWFNGGEGDDSFTGGDIEADNGNGIWYGDNPGGVTINFAAGNATDGWGDTDTFTGINFAFGSDFADVFNGVGHDVNHWWNGLAGADQFLGGANWDTISYEYEEGVLGIQADFGAGTVTDTFGDTDTFSSIEEIQGSANDDTIIGDGNDNSMQGRAGADTLTGNGGDDNIRGEAGADIISGGTGRDWIEGGAGADQIDGGDDWDVLFYRDEVEQEGGTQGVTVNLGTNSATDSFGDTDTISNIEEVIGTNLDDDITGDGNDNALQGEDGNDTLDGGGGNDYIEGGAGDDTMTGGAGFDEFRITESAGNDTITDFEAGQDSDDVINLDLGAGNGFTFDDLIANATQDGPDTVLDLGGGNTLRLENVLIGDLHHDDFWGLYYGTEINAFSGLPGTDIPAILEDILASGVLDSSSSDEFVLQYVDGADTYELTATGSAFTFGGSPIDGGTVNTLRLTLNGDDLLLVENASISSGEFNTFLDDLANQTTNSTVWGDQQVSYHGSEDTDVFTAGDSDDFVEGQEGDDELYGGDGDDELRGGDGTDILYGGDGDDNLRGDEGGDQNQGDDQLFGGAGNDSFKGGDGADLIDGGDGDRDRVNYNLETTFTGDDATHGVIVNLSDDDLTGVSVTGIPSTTVDAGTAIDARNNVDTLFSIEEVEGTGYDDIIVGSDADNDIVGNEGDDDLRGGDGNDWITGGAGNDTIDGGDGDEDWANYDWDHEVGGSQGIVADLGAGTVTDTFGDSDTLVGIERISGSAFDDDITGDGNDNELDGREGNDELYGLGGEDDLRGREGDDDLYGGDDNDWLTGGEGNDLLDGGAGDEDWANYDWDHEVGGTQGIVADLGGGTVTDTFGDTDTLVGIERISGSAFDDDITGDGNDNELDGREGNDVIRGEGGQDELRGREGDDELHGGDGDDRLRGDEGNDELFGGDGEDRLRGGEGDDDLTGGAGFDIFEFEEEGNTGVDTIHDFQTGDGSDDVINLFWQDGSRVFTWDDIMAATSDDGTDTTIDLGGGDLIILKNVLKDDLTRDDFWGLVDGLHILADSGAPEHDIPALLKDVLDNGSIDVADADHLVVSHEINGEPFELQVHGSGLSYDGPLSLDGGSVNRIVFQQDGETLYLIFNANLSPADVNGLIDDIVNETFNYSFLDSDRVNYSGSEYDDGAFGGAQDDYMEGREGADTIDGRGGNDEIHGDDGEDTIFGGDGHDNLYGGADDDEIHGGEGRDWLYGDDGNDTLIGDGGSNAYVGGQGNDTFDGSAGGGGTDFVYYLNEDGGGAVNIDLLNGTATDTYGDTDTLIEIFAANGTNQGDIIATGNATTDIFYLTGHGGNDTFTGGAAWDIVEYFWEFGGNSVNVNWGTGTATDTHGDTDSFTGIDAFSGTNADDVFDASNGSDSEVYGLGGADTIIGGAGNNTVNYSWDEQSGGWAGIDVDLDAGTGVDGFGETDTLTDIDNVIGTDAGDIIRGDANGNTFRGNDGNDLFEGRGGDDLIEGGDGLDLFIHSTGDGNDTIEDFDATAEKIDISGHGLTSSQFGSLSITQQGDDTLIDFGGGDSITLLDTTAGDVTQDNFVYAAGSQVQVNISGDLPDPTVLNLLIALHGDGTVSNNSATQFDLTADSDSNLTAVVYGTSLTYDGFLDPDGGTVTGGDYYYDFGSGPVLFMTVTNLSVDVVTFNAASEDAFNGDFTALLALMASFEFDVDASGANGSVNINGFGNADTFLLSDFDDSLQGAGGPGNDWLDGSLGRDILDYSQEGGPQNINANLHTGVIFDTWGSVDYVLGFDELIGSSLNDVIVGSAHDEQFRGGDGNDIIDGGGGHDNVDGDDGDDDLFGGTGDDWFFGGQGNDVIDGGSLNGEQNGVWHVGDPGSVTFDFANGIVTDGWGDTDTIQNINMAFGSNFDDTFIGWGDDNSHFWIGMEGADDFQGGWQHDKISYVWEEGLSGITVDMAAGTVVDTYGDTDTFDDEIEAIQGSQLNDTFIGDDRNNNFEGMDGADDFQGGDGWDQVEYQNETGGPGGFQGVVIDLDAGSGTDTFGATDTFSGIEGIVGSDFDDQITGDGNDNFLAGLDDADTLNGGGGNDNLVGGRGNDIIDGGDDWDRLNYMDEVDWQGGFQGVVVNLSTNTATDAFGDTDTISNVEAVNGTWFDDDITGDGNDNELEGFDGNDILNGGGGHDWIAGGRGNDTIDGGDGVDMVSYEWEHESGGENGVTVDLAAGTATDTFGDSDTLANIERVSGSIYDDTIDGDDDDNQFEAAAGNDVLDGRGGNDNLIGDGGDDTLTGGSGDDEFRYLFELGDFGNDTITDFQAGAGTDDQITLDLDGQVVTFADIIANAVQDGSDTILNFDGYGTIRLQNVDIGDLHEDDFLGLTSGLNVNFFAGAPSVNMPAIFNDVALNAVSVNEQSDLFEMQRIDGGDTYDMRLEGSGFTYSGGALTGGTISAIYLELNGSTLFRVVNGAIPYNLFNDLMTEFAAGNPIPPTDVWSTDNVFFNGSDEADGFSTGSQDDELEGHDGDDQLDGGGGNDILRGGDGADMLFGGEGEDELRGQEGDDQLFGGAGDDELKGGDGADTMDGGDDWDRINYNLETVFTGDGATHGVIVNMSSSQLVGVSVTGIPSTNVDAGTAIDTRNNVDTLVNIEQVDGTGYDDIIVGSDVDNDLFGNAGDDDLRGEGGNDWITGGAGNDLIDGGGGDHNWANYDFDDEDGGTQGIVANLNSGSVTDTFGDTDTLTNIDRISGSQFDDDITGNADDNVFRGRDGMDTIDGGAGEDEIDGGDGDDTIIGGADNDTLFGDTGADTFVFTADASTDTVEDFDYAGDGDLLDISSFGYTSTADFSSITMDGATTVINLDGTTIIRLDNFDLISEVGDPNDAFIFS